MRLIITGTKNLNVYEAYTAIRNNFEKFENVDTIITPGSLYIGAAIAAEYYAKNKGVDLEIYPINRKKNKEDAEFINDHRMLSVAEGLLYIDSDQSEGKVNIVESALEQKLIVVHIKIPIK